MSYSIVEAAKTYASLGYSVIPLNGKVPRAGTNGSKDATTNEEVIDQWWSDYPNANIGLVSGAESGFFGLDIDPNHGGDESLAGLINKYGELPPTPTVHTGGGGTHYYFRNPTDGTIIRNATQLAGSDGIDIRGEGGYLVAPPSVHPVTGKKYRWAEGLDLECGMAPAPEWLLNLMIPKTDAQNTPAGGSSSEWADIIQGADEGCRNDRLARVSGLLFRSNLPAVVSVELAGLWAENRTNPPLRQEEISAVLDSIAGREIERRS